MAAAAARPDSVKQLRACIKCRLIKTYEQFKLGYCENCRSNRPARDTEGMRADWVASNTTPDYEGMVSLMQPGASWAARWLQYSGEDEDGNTYPLLPGLYAIKLPGEEARAAEAAAAGDEEDEYEEEEAAEEEGEAAAAAPARGAGSSASAGGGSKAKGAAGGGAGGKRLGHFADDDPLARERFETEGVARDDDE